MNRQLLAVGGLGLAAVLAAMWFSAHGPDLHPGPNGISWVIGIGIACLPVVVGLQILRTGYLLGMRPRTALTRLTQPLLYAHGMNVLLPSMLGDLFEVWAVSQRVGQPVRRVLAVLLHRFAGTITALTLLAAVALLPRMPSVAVLLGTTAVFGYIAVDFSSSRWSRWIRIPGHPPPGAMQPFGLIATLGHLGLAVFQHGVEVVAVFCLGIGLGSPISPAAAAGMVSLVEAVTYLPIPLAGAGANHWGATSVLSLLGTSATASAVLVATTHALQVLVGAASVGIGLTISTEGDVAARPAA